MHQKDLSPFKIIEFNRKLYIILNELSFILAIHEDLRPEVVMWDDLHLLVLKIQFIKSVFVVGALDLDKLLSFGEARVLGDNDVVVGQLVRRVVLVFEDLAEHDTLVEFLDFYAVLAEVVGEDSAIQLLDISDGVSCFHVVVLWDHFNTSSRDGIMVLKGSQLLHDQLLLIHNIAWVFNVIHFEYLKRWLS